MFELENLYSIQPTGKEKRAKITDILPESSPEFLGLLRLMRDWYVTLTGKGDN